MYKPVVLVILDGWGISTNNQGNAIKKAKTPTIDKLNGFYPMIAIQASGISAGLPWGENGNSEVGHMILGAGKIIYQSLPRITLAIQDGSFYLNDALLAGMENVNKNNSQLHLMGLIGEGSVHSYVDHLFALIDLAKRERVEKVFLHIFTDGRDSAPTSATKVLRNLQEKLNILGLGKIASLCGRNWAMDRNNNWDRVEKAYKMMVEGIGEKITEPISYLQDCYAKNVTDEYIEPAVITEKGSPIGLVRDNDTIIFFNFREDRAREITKAFVLPGFDKFRREKQLKIEFVAMTEYEKDLPVSVVFPPELKGNSLGEFLSRNKVRQLRIAETEKYAHVTYFFNGGREDPWPGEDRVLIPSPAVSKFDQTPEMSAPQITEKIIEAVKEQKYGFILANYANADMVGHTGNEPACIEAVQSIDKSLSLIIPEILKVGGCLLITADHGNIEQIRNYFTGEIDTEHSSNPVPLWYITPDNHRKKSPEEIDIAQVTGIISDVAPTVLAIMEIQKPKEMTGENLLPLLK
jgi:2,3-bisphosphoglycerate-independent phosphoglycerate mutase